MARAETVIAGLADPLGDAPRARMERYDELNGGTIDGGRDRPGDETEASDDG